MPSRGWHHHLMNFRVLKYFLVFFSPPLSVSLVVSQCSRLQSRHGIAVSIHKLGFADGHKNRAKCVSGAHLNTVTHTNPLYIIESFNFPSCSSAFHWEESKSKMNGESTGGDIIMASVYGLSPSFSLLISPTLHHLYNSSPVSLPRREVALDGYLSSCFGI